MIREVLVIHDPSSGPSATGEPPDKVERVTLRLRHQPTSDAPPPYHPPAEARQVASWEPPAAGFEGLGITENERLSAGPIFGEEITVSLVDVVARIVDSRGEPIRGLTPEDLIAEVAGTEVPIVDVEWSSDLQPAVEAPAFEAEQAGSRPRLEAPEFEVEPATTPEKLVILFLQVDLEPTRVAGHLKILPDVEKLLNGLHPDDRVAIVSFDSHLKVWLDFSRDRIRTFEILQRAVSYGTPVPKPGDSVSLLRHLDRQAAVDAATPEVALRVTAEALAPLPGEKDLIFLGWGLGRYGIGGVRMTADFSPAVRALGTARATVFVLDVSQADYHSLEVGLQSVAASTGGTYDRTFRFATQAIRRLARTLGGHYVVTVDRSAMPAARGQLTLRLKNKSGRVLHRPLILG